MDNRADDTKIGTPWRDDELDAIIAHYFSMLQSELARVPYVKAHHSAALMTRIHRTHRSVEFKHQNISAVLDELGLPWIPGYKPKRNYQAAIFDAIDRFLSAHPDFLTNANVTSALSSPDQTIFVSPPAVGQEPEPPRRLQQLIRKFDPVERDHRNRTLGRAGEAFVVELERRRLAQADRHDLSGKVQWVAAEQGDGAGFDIISFDLGGKERLIEVKTTNGSARTAFFLSRSEFEVARERPDAWCIYRVHLFAQAPKIFTITPPLEKALRLRTETWRASLLDFPIRSFDRAGHNLSSPAHVGLP